MIIPAVWIGSLGTGSVSESPSFTGSGQMARYPLTLYRADAVYPKDLCRYHDSIGNDSAHWGSLRSKTGLFLACFIESSVFRYGKSFTLGKPRVGCAERPFPIKLPVHNDISTDIFPGLHIRIGLIDLCQFVVLRDKFIKFDL